MAGTSFSLLGFWIQTGTLLSRGIIITVFLEVDGKLLTSHDRSPSGYFSCLLSMLAPFVALGKSLKFSGARFSSGVKKHKCMRDSAMPSYNSRGPGPHPISRMGILALTYLTRMLWGLMVIQHFEDVKSYVTPKYYPTLVLKMLLGICRISLKAWNVWLPFQFASDGKQMQNIYSYWLTGWVQLHLNAEEGLA